MTSYSETTKHHEGGGAEAKSEQQRQRDGRTQDLRGSGRPQDVGVEVVQHFRPRAANFFCQSGVDDELPVVYTVETPGTVIIVVGVVCSRAQRDNWKEGGQSAQRDVSGSGFSKRRQGGLSFLSVTTKERTAEEDNLSSTSRMETSFVGLEERMSKEVTFTPRVLGNYINLHHSKDVAAVSRAPAGHTARRSRVNNRTMSNTLSGTSLYNAHDATAATRRSLPAGTDCVPDLAFARPPLRCAATGVVCRDYCAACHRLTFL